MINSSIRPLCMFATARLIALFAAIHTCRVAAYFEEDFRSQFADAVRDLQSQGYAVLQSFADASEVKSLKERVRTHVEAWNVSETLAQTTGSRERTRYFLQSEADTTFFLDKHAEEALLRGSVPIPVTVDAKLAMLSNIGHALHLDDPVFRRFTTSPKISELIYRDLKFVDPRLPQSQYRVRESTSRPQQDSTSMFTLPFQTAVALWFALDDADSKDSCLWLKPSSHFQQVRHRLRRHGDDSLEPVPVAPSALAAPLEDKEIESVEAAQAAGFHPVPVRAGDLILIHGEADYVVLQARRRQPQDAWVVHVVEGPGNGVTWHPENWQQSPDNFISPDIGVRLHMKEQETAAWWSLQYEQGLQYARFKAEKDQFELFEMARALVLGRVKMKWSDNGKTTDPCARAIWMSNLVQLLDMTNVHIAEVGVFRGVHAQCTLKRFRSEGHNVVKYYAVDLWRSQSNYNDNCNRPDAEHAEHLRETIGRLQEFWSVVRLLPMASSLAAKTIAEATLDVVFIDARHDYCGVAQDLSSWWPLLKPGGLMLGHDYWIDITENETLCSNGSLIHGGVRRAVAELVRDRKLELFIVDILDVWAVRKPSFAASLNGVGNVPSNA